MLPTGPLVLQSSPIRIIQHILQARSIAPICHFYLERFRTMELLWYLCNCLDIITVHFSTYITCRFLQHKSTGGFFFFLLLFFSLPWLYLGPSPFLIPFSTPAPWDTSPITFLFPMGHWQAHVRIFAPSQVHNTVPSTWDKDRLAHCLSVCGGLCLAVKWNVVSC